MDMLMNGKHLTFTSLITALGFLRTSFAMACTLPQVSCLVLKEEHGSQVFEVKVKVKGKIVPVLN
jgi:hypothetical protein